VVAYPDIVERETAPQEVVDLLDRPACHASAGYLRLVRDDNQEKTPTAQPLARLRDVGRDLDFVQSQR
jgi:hypothetical protein